MDRTARMTTADRMMRDAEKKFLKHMSDADKVKKGWRNPNIKEQGVTEGYDGSEPLDLNSKPSVNDIFKRALYIHDYEGYGNNMDYSEDEAIDQYLERTYGPDMVEKLNRARHQSYFGRDDGRGSGHLRSSNLGSAGAKPGQFRTTKAGVMHKQDARLAKDKIKDRLGRHPAPALPENVNEVSDATLTSYLSKVHADSQKHDKDPSKRSAAKRNKSVTGFARAFNKLDARKEKTDEGLADDFMKLAKEKGYNARLRGTPEQERERTQQMLAQRAADRAAQPAPQGPGPERRAELQAKLKELEAQFDPNYDYSDDHRFWSQQNALAQQIQGIRRQLSITEISKQKLGDYLHAAHQDVVDRASSGSFRSGQAGDKYNKADASPKEKQREIGMQRAVKKLSMAEAWTRRYPNLHADIAECKSAGDTEQLKRLMAIKNIIDGALGEQSGLGFGQ